MYWKCLSMLKAFTLLSQLRWHSVACDCIFLCGLKGEQRILPVYMSLERGLNWQLQTNCL